MAISVNPPPILKLPKAFLEDREVREFIKQQNTILFQLWNRTGGVNDDVDEAKENITASSSRVSRNAGRINSLELKTFELVETSVGLTTKEFEIIDCINTGSIEIILDPEAIGEDEVLIARSGARVRIIGVVNGKTNIDLNVKGFSVHLIKQITGNGWLQI